MATYASGQIADAASLNTITGSWTDWSGSFALTAVTTNPTLGNSIVVARYIQMGMTVHYTFKVQLGSTFTAGSGAYNFPVPVAAHSGRSAIGSAWINDSGTALRFGVATFDQSTTSLRIFYGNGALASVLDSAGSGTAWAANDAFMVSITYERA